MQFVYAFQYLQTLQAHICLLYFLRVKIEKNGRHYGKVKNL